MQSLYIATVLFGFGNHKERLRVYVDDGGGADTNLRINVSGTRLDIGRWNSRCSRRGSMSRAEHAGLPQGPTIHAAIAVGVKRVNRVMFRNHEKNVVLGPVRQSQVAHIQ